MAMANKILVFRSYVNHKLDNERIYPNTHEQIIRLGHAISGNSDADVTYTLARYADNGFEYEVEEYLYNSEFIQD